MIIAMSNKETPAPTLERRVSTEKAELRQVAEGKNEVFGYALKWGVTYDMGWFTEEVHRDALKNADLSDVRVLFNHDPNFIVGRTKSGTAEVGVDETGLWYRAQIPDSPNGQNLAVALQRGDVDQSSWGFYINSRGDEWTVKDNKDHRTVKSVRAVVDTSPVTYPANPDTSAAKRSKDEFALETASAETMKGERVDMTNTYKALQYAYTLKK